MPTTSNVDAALDVLQSSWPFQFLVGEFFTRKQTPLDIIDNDGGLGKNKNTVRTVTACQQPHLGYWKQECMSTYNIIIHCNAMR